METKQYETLELTFYGEEPKEKIEVPVTCTFSQNENRVSVRGFYAGNGIYKVRYLPLHTGALHYEVESALSLEGELSGDLSVLPHDPDRHGPVRARGIHLAYEDGTRFHSIGTTIYAMVHQTKDVLKQTYVSLAASPFNKVRLCIFPKFYDFNHNEPERFPFVRRQDGTFDFDTPDVRFWDVLEENLKHLDRMGIQADLILFHPYDHWGFAEMSFEQCMGYLSYVTRRLSAFPNVWWSLANEYDLMDHFEQDWWKQFAAYIHDNDPAGHMLSNHQCITEWDFADPNTTHVCLQSSAMVRAVDYEERFHKPVLYDECCYEGNLAYNWGNITGQELVNRFWIATVLGAYATHGETILEDPDDPEPVLWWAKGGRLKGKSVPRIAFLKKIVSSLPGDIDPVPTRFDQEKMKQDPSLPTVMRMVARMPRDQFLSFLDGNREIAGQVGEHAFLWYFADRCPCLADLTLPADNEYEIEVIDTWNMTRTAVNGAVSGNVRVRLPGKPYQLILAKKQS